MNEHRPYNPAEMYPSRVDLAPSDVELRLGENWRHIVQDISEPKARYKQALIDIIGARTLREAWDIAERALE